MQMLEGKIIKNERVSKNDNCFLLVQNYPKLSKILNVPNFYPQKCNNCSFYLAVYEKNSIFALDFVRNNIFYSIIMKNEA